MAVPCPSMLTRLVVSSSVYRRAVQDGWSADDLLQDVLLRLVELDAAGHGWDAARSKLGHYVVLVTAGVVANARRDAGRAKRGRGMSVRPVDGSECGSVTTLDEALEAMIREAGLDDLEAHMLRELVRGSRRRTSTRARRVLAKVGA